MDYFDVNINFWKHGQGEALTKTSISTATKIENENSAPRACISSIIEKYKKN